MKHMTRRELLGSIFGSIVAAALPLAAKEILAPAVTSVVALVKDVFFFHSALAKNEFLVRLAIEGKPFTAPAGTMAVWADPKEFPTDVGDVEYSDLEYEKASFDSLRHAEGFRWNEGTLPHGFRSLDGSYQP